MTDVLPYKRRERHEADGVAYFLTFSCYQRRPLFSNDAIKDRFVERLTAVADVSILAWVVMPEHVHLVLAPAPGRSMPGVLRAIKTPFAREVLNRWRAIAWDGLPRLRDEKGHHFWQEGGGHDRIVYGHELREKIAYVHANPCRRGLAATPADYRWSSAAAYVGGRTFGPAIDFDSVPRGPRPLV